ncbi:unnamed protein product [Cunninghamella blakesleeana]
MKFTTVGLIALAATAQSVLGQTACSDQAVFDLCLQNQDNYLKTCGPTDYQCLCQWNKAKLTCYTSCPNDPTKGSQDNVVASYCNIPGANVTSTWTGSITTPTASSSVSASGSASPTQNKTSNGNKVEAMTGLMALGAAAIYYMI